MKIGETKVIDKRTVGNYGMVDTWPEFLVLEKLGSSEFRLDTKRNEVIDEAYNYCSENDLIDEKGNLNLPDQIDGKDIFVDNDYIYTENLVNSDDDDPGVIFTSHDQQIVAYWLKKNEWNYDDFIKAFIAEEQVVTPTDDLKSSRSEESTIFKTRSNKLALEKLKKLKPLAEQGDSESAYQLGEMYRCGLETSRNYIEAIKWHRLAAEHGHAMAQLFLGIMYRNGTGVTQDKKESAKWFNLAGNHEDTSSRGYIAEICRRSGDYPEAFKWFKLAAEKGDVADQSSLARMYREGLGVSRDYNMAFKWYRIAADQGFAAAQICVGEMYQVGEGVDQDEKEAIRWYKVAAEQGDPEAIKQIENITNKKIWLSREK